MTATGYPVLSIFWTMLEFFFFFLWIWLAISVFADIFRSNALKNGLLPIVVEAERHRQLFELVAAEPSVELTVDLEAQLIHLPGDEDLPFDVDPFAKAMLLAGTDEIGWLLQRMTLIESYQAAHPARIDTRVGAD